MQGMVSGKKAEESQDRDGRKTSQIRLVRWQQQADVAEDRHNFAETSDEDPRRSYYMQSNYVMMFLFLNIIYLLNVIRLV